MTLELTFAAAMLTMVALALWHSFATRPRHEAWMLLVTGVGFGYLFPIVDVNLFGQYTFHGELTFQNLPLHLGLSWYALYYMSLGLGEYLVGGRGGRRGEAGRARPLATAIVTGLVFGLLEAQWDPTLLNAGLMEFFVPSFAKYPLGFHVGCPMLHAYLGFAWAYGFLLLRDAPRPGLATAALLASYVLLPLGLMASVPIFEPVYAWVGERLSQPVNVVLDLVHFSTTFASLGFIAALWLRWLARRMGGAAVAHAGGEAT